MIRLDRAVIVEGKYDKITLENVIDATIIVTNGFAVFRDKQKCELIRTLALKNGVIVVTDSDSAGAVIRSYIKKLCPKGSITNVYIPQLKGKEKRKQVGGKEGLLGVEGMSKEIIEEAFKRSGIFSVEEKSVKRVTKTDLFEYGLSGCADSAFKRKSLSVFLKLPDNLSANGFLDAVNAVYGFDEFIKAVEKWQLEADKN